MRFYQILALLTFLFLFACTPEQSKPYSEEDIELKLRKERIDSILERVEDRSQKRRQRIKIKSNDINFETPPKITAEELDARLPSNEKNYYLVIGSFKDYENAMVLINEFKNAEILQDNNMNRVSVARLSNLSEAMKAIHIFKKKYPKTSVWLYSR